MRLFPFSLTGKTKAWLQSQPNQSLTSCKDMKYKFLYHIFPPFKSTKAKASIATFVQGVEEPLCDAWERFGALLRNSPTMVSSSKWSAKFLQWVATTNEVDTKCVIWWISIVQYCWRIHYTIIENMTSTDSRSKHGRA